MLVVLYPQLHFFSDIFQSVLNHLVIYLQAGTLARFMQCIGKRLLTAKLKGRFVPLFRWSLPTRLLEKWTLQLQQPNTIHTRPSQRLYTLLYDLRDPFHCLGYSNADSLWPILPPEQPVTHLSPEMLDQRRSLCLRCLKHW